MAGNICTCQIHLISVSTICHFKWPTKKTTLIWILDLKFKPVIVVAILQLSSNIASHVTISLHKNCRKIFLKDFLGLLFIILLLKIVELNMKNRDTPQVSYTVEIQWKMKYNTNPSCLQSYIFQVCRIKNSNNLHSLNVLLTETAAIVRHSDSLLLATLR